MWARLTSMRLWSSALRVPEEAVCYRNARLDGVACCLRSRSLSGEVWARRDGVARVIAAIAYSTVYHKLLTVLSCWMGLQRAIAVKWSCASLVCQNASIRASPKTGHKLSVLLAYLWSIGFGSPIGFRLSFGSPFARVHMRHESSATPYPQCGDAAVRIMETRRAAMRPIR